MDVREKGEWTIESVEKRFALVSVVVGALVTDYFDGQVRHNFGVG